MIKSTTIRVSIEQRNRLRLLAEESEATMADTLDQALEALRRNNFYRAMADAEQTLRSDQSGWNEYARERDRWLNPDLASP